MSRSNTLPEREKIANSSSMPTAVWLGEATGDLRFCWDRLKSVTRIIHVDEAWTQGVDWSSLKPQFAFIGLNSRSDPVDSLLETVYANWPKAKLHVVLSGWWSGHRRCHPLDDTLEIAYWYQWWDCVLPSVLAFRPDRKKPKQATRIERILSASTDKPVSTQSRLALVLTEGQTRREFWTEGLRSMGWLSAFPMTGSLDVMGEFDVIVFDVAGSFSKYAFDAVQESLEELGRIRKRFPLASIIVVDSFPTLERWESWISAGAERILASPFCWAGFSVESETY